MLKRLDRLRDSCQITSQVCLLFVQDFNEEEQSRLGNIVSGAVITSNGKLTKNFEYIDELRRVSTQTLGDFAGVEHKVLVLGAGYVSAPVVEYLTRDSNIGVTVASAIKEEANKLAQRFQQTEPVLLDVGERPDLMASLIQDASAVVSLLPWDLHPEVGGISLFSKDSLITLPPSFRLPSSASSTRRI